MKFDYYSSLKNLAEQIDSFCCKCANDTPKEFRHNAEKWRELVCGRLYEDFLPPIDRRDLLNLMQGLMLVTYEISFAFSCNEINSAAGIVLCSAAAKGTKAIYEETGRLKARSCCTTRIRKEALRLVAETQNCQKADCDSNLCQNFRNAALAMISYSDSLESAIILNN